jgi:hypothetical protein
MVSVVDTSVKHFGSFMGGAMPVMNAVAGSMEAIVYACLVTGIDTKPLVSLTVSGGIATATYTGSHSATPESVVLIAGVTGALVALNGEQKIIAKPNAGSVQFATAAPDGVASGSITMKMAPLGWVRPFSGANLGAYKSADPASTGMFLRMDDTGTQTCRVVGYESMSDISSGLGAFPTNTVIPGGGSWGKSSAANSNPVQWLLIGDGRTFYLHVSTYMGIATGGAYDRYTVGALRGFGDMIVLRPGGDPYACALSAYFDPASPGAWVSYPSGAVFDNAAQQLYTPRTFSGLGSAYGMASYPYTGLANSISGLDTTFASFPSRIDGKLRLSRRYLRSFDASFPEPRCEVPGVHTIPQTTVAGQINHRDIVPVTGDLAARKLMALSVGAAYSSDPSVTGNAGITLIDITGPWR